MWDLVTRVYLIIELSTHVSLAIGWIDIHLSKDMNKYESNTDTPILKYSSPIAKGEGVKY